jgi:hypothetical protein
LPKRSRTVALKENVVLGAEEKCVTTIPGLTHHNLFLEKYTLL